MKTDSEYPPIDPQNVIDLVFSATFYNSSDLRGQKFGEYLFFDSLKEYKEKYRDDDAALAYIRTLEPIIGSALRAFSVEKLNYKRKILPLEQIQQGEQAILDDNLNLMPIVGVSKGYSRWTVNLSLILLGILGSTIPIPWTYQNSNLIYILAFSIIAGSLSIIISIVIRRSIRYFLTKKFMKKLSKDLDRYWSESYLKYESTLFDTLISSIRAKELFYPHLFTFVDGHLFPREDLPYLPPPNFKTLTPSKKKSSELVDILNEVVKARISIKPGVDKIKSLKSLIKDSE